MRNEYEGTDHVGYVVETGHPELNQVLRVSIATSRWGSTPGDTGTSKCEDNFPIHVKVQDFFWEKDNHRYILGPRAQYPRLQRSWGHTR